MIINGKKIEFADVCVSNTPDTSKHIWVAYDKSKARLPVAFAPTAESLAEMMGVSKKTVTGNWHNYRAGRLKTAKYAKVYIGDTDDE